MNLGFELKRRHWLALHLSAMPMLAHAQAPASVVPLLVGTGTPSDTTSRVLAWLARSAGIRWDLRPTPWLRAQKQAISGEGLMYGLSRTLAREQELKFSRPIQSNHTWAVVRREEMHGIQRLRDLRGQTICWARGSSYGDTLTQAGLGQVNGLEAADDEGALRMVVARRCRAALVTVESASPRLALKHPALADIDQLGLELTPAALTTTALHFVTGHHSPWLWAIERINQVVSRHPTQLARLNHA